MFFCNNSENNDKKKEKLKVKVDDKLQDYHKTNPLDQGLEHLLLMNYS